MGTTYDKLVPDEDYTRPSPSVEEQAREGGIELIRADPLDLCRDGMSRRARGAKIRRLLGDYDY